MANQGRTDEIAVLISLRRYEAGTINHDFVAPGLAYVAARETAEMGKRLCVARLNHHGKELGEGGRPVLAEVLTPLERVKAPDALYRICDLAEELGVVFTLENLNLPVDHAGVPFAPAEGTVALVAAVDRPQLRLILYPYHAQIGEGNLIELCQACLP